MEKPWRLHLANSAIQHIDLISGSPAMLAVWARDGKVSYFELENGSAHGTAEFAIPESPEQWWALIGSLKDPKARQLPYARIGGLSIWPLKDGRALTYNGREKIELGKQDTAPQDVVFDVTPAAVAIDPTTLLVAAVDSKGALLVGKVGGTVKTIKPGLKPADDLPMLAAVARGGKRIVVSDGARLVVIDSGKVSSRRELHYVCGKLALAPGGKRLVVFDSDSGVLRVYDPATLKLTHQRFVADILSTANELQLIAFADLPPASAALSALATDDAGRIAFAVSGQICVTPLSVLTPTESPAPAKDEGKGGGS